MKRENFVYCIRAPIIKKIFVSEKHIELFPSIDGFYCTHHMSNVFQCHHESNIDKSNFMFMSAYQSEFNLEQNLKRELGLNLQLNSVNYNEIEDLPLKNKKERNIV